MSDLQGGAVKVRVDVIGDGALRAQLQALGRAGVPIVVEAFDAATARMVAKGKARAPVDEEHDPGALRDSIRRTSARGTSAGRVSAGFVAGGTPLQSVTIGEGHALNIYAAIQEEDTSLRHNNGQSHYMLTSFYEEVGKVQEDIQRGIDRVTG